MHDIFVVHSGGRLYAYINSCPHTGASLEWLEHRFLDIENVFIQCSNHGALFEIDSGHCIAGPCAGEHLTAVKLEINQGEIVVELP